MQPLAQDFFVGQPTIPAGLTMAEYRRPEMASKVNLRVRGGRRGRAAARLRRLCALNIARLDPEGSETNED